MNTDKRLNHQIKKSNNPYTIFSLDKKGNILAINELASSGMDLNPLIGKPFSSLVSIEEIERVNMYVDKVVETKETISYEFHSIDDSLCRVIKIPIVINKRFLGIHALFEKISNEIKKNKFTNNQKKLDLKEAGEKYKNLIEKAFIGVYIIQHDRLIYVNEWITKILGVTEQELLGTYYFEVIKEEDRERVINNYQKLIEREKDFLVDEIQIVNASGEIRFWELQASYTFMNGDLAVTGIASDITEKKKIKADLEYFAFHDGLLRLPNMNFLNQVISKELETANTHGKSYCMMFFDLDRFKLINDSYGHQIGDQVLKITSKRLVDIIKDIGTVVRAGADEFIITLPNINQSQAEKIAKDLLIIITETFQLKEIEMRISASIGIAFLQQNDQLEELIQKASAALNYAKAKGRNQYQFYSIEYLQIANRRVQLEQRLRIAFEQKKLEIYFQPKLDLFTNQITGIEALLRWSDPHFGTVSPVEFIPIAEETGLINSIGKWVLTVACSQNSEWQREGFLPMDVCVNISSIQFLQDDFVNMVEEILIDSKLPPINLNLEITEGIAINNIENAIEKLKKLKQLGISISLDDFGTGYSSLNYLKSLPIDYLKIDRTFINGILESKQDTEIIHSIISLAHSLSLKVVAEGVEEKHQLQVLNEMGCDEIQGYYLAKPMPPPQLEQFLKDRKLQAMKMR